MNILLLPAFVVWLYLLHVLTKGKFYFFKYIVGCVGMFLFTMVLLQATITVILCRGVAATVGMIGGLTGCFHAYYQYVMILISHNADTVSMYIDYECSGVIEIMAFSSLLWFFPLYNTLEKIMYNLAGIFWIFLSNIIRLVMICFLIYFYGNNIYFFAHTIFGRIIFYVLTIILYFYVFTKPQIVRQKVGGFLYGSHSK